jgi:hypothetical protein
VESIVFIASRYRVLTCWDQQLEIIGRHIDKIDEFDGKRDVKGEVNSLNALN